MDIDAVAEMLRLPAFPYPLELPSPGVTYEERRRHIEAVRADLADRGLVTEDDPTGELRDALELLASGELVIDGRLVTHRPLDLVGAVRGSRAALAVQTGETVQIHLVHDSMLVGMIVDLLPAARKLTGSSTTIPYEALTTALTTVAESADFLEFERILASAGVRAREVRMLAELVRATNVAAQFGVALRTPATEAYRQRRVWAWYATDAGGVLMSHDSNDPPAWTTLVPADPARVGQFLGDALHALRYGRT